METFTDILFWVSIFSGGLLILLMLLSLIGGLDLDVDLELGSPDVETDAGGLGLIKGFLTFISTSSWVIKILIVTKQNIWLATAMGIAVGIICFIILNYIFKLLLKNESNVNWNMDDALFQKGKVYLKVPPAEEGSGIVQIEINGALREIKAKSKDEMEVKTGEPIRVVDVKGEYVIVEKETL